MEAVHDGVLELTSVLHKAKTLLVNVIAGQDVQRTLSSIDALLESLDHDFNDRHRKRRRACDDLETRNAAVSADTKGEDGFYTRFLGA